MDIQILQNLKAQLVEVQEEITALETTIEAEDRDLTDEEQAQMDGYFAQFEKLEIDIARKEKILNQQAKVTKPQDRQAAPQTPEPQMHAEQQTREIVPARKRPLIEVNNGPAGHNGFKSFGHFMIATANAGMPGGAMDPRLVMNQPTNYSGTLTDAEGGFAVPPDFREAIVKKVMGEASLLSRTDQLQTANNTITMPVDETTPWQDTGGIQAYWGAEAAQMTDSKMLIGENSITLNKLYCLVPVTEELLSDAPLTESYINAKVPDKMNFKISDAIINGTGTGQPTGILGHAGTIVVAKENLQAADTIVYKNITNMYARLYGDWAMDAVWITSQDVLAELMNMEFPSAAGTAVPAWMPPGMLADSPHGRLMGKPIILSQACSVLGDSGDLILASLSQYMTAVKSGGGVRQDVSIHLYFDYDISTFRFIFRMAGQPWWATAITQNNSANTAGAFVVLADRA